jgi:hypothetical protein
MEGTGNNLRLPMNPPFNSEFESIYSLGVYQRCSNGTSPRSTSCRGRTF